MLNVTHRRVFVSQTPVFLVCEDAHEDVSWVTYLCGNMMVETKNI